MSRLGHLTPRYVLDRVAVLAHQRRHPDAPWLTAAMIDLLGQWLRPTDIGLEWGAGRSTAWFAARVAHVTAVEDNAGWGTTVAAMLKQRGLSDRVDLNLIPIEKSGRTAGASYVSVAQKVAPESLDFCLVDGDLRDYCALAALPLLKPGGVLVIDNIERYLPRANKSRSPNARGPADGFASPEWQELAEQIGNWRSIWTSDGVTDTALWIKPAAA
jgi:predicted O-methyltransferase YrrM